MREVVYIRETLVGRPLTLALTRQVDLLMGGPSHFLEKLLDMAPEKRFMLEMAQRKVQVLLQVCGLGRGYVGQQGGGS